MNNNVNNVREFKTSYDGIFPLTNTKAPTVLIESFFHTNKENVKFLSTKKGREELASIYANGIINFLDSQKNN
jgi:N-acetylmuramoyl-L-alanine amidase